MKIKPGHRRDYEAYLRQRRAWAFVPKSYASLPIEQGTDDNVLAFVEYESLGKIQCKPKEPDEVRLALEGKAQLNAQIAMWAEGAVWCGGLAHIGIELERDPELSWLPSWVWEAVKNQYRRHKAKETET